MSPRVALIIAAIAGLLAVGLGAFGAHALKKLLTPDLLSTWNTAVDYLFYHALAVLALSAWMQASRRSASLVVIAWCVGMLLFSGSLFVYCLTGIKWLVYLTPVGGSSLLLGWLVLLVQASRLPPAPVE